MSPTGMPTSLASRNSVIISLKTSMALADLVGIPGTSAGLDKASAKLMRSDRLRRDVFKRAVTDAASRDMMTLRSEISSCGFAMSRR